LSSYIYLTLDTTPPEIDIFTPNYTTNSARTEITVTSNEPLAQWQDVYIIDSLGRRHDVVFRNDGDELVGEIIFDGYPLGISTVYARVMDEVGNKSALASKSFNIVSSETLTISLSESVNDIVIKSENGFDVMVVEGVRIELNVTVEDEVSNHVDVDDESTSIVTVRSEEVK
jgi:hypothetical protein